MPFENKPHSSAPCPGISTGPLTADELGDAPAGVLNPPASLPLRSTCRIVRQMISEMTELAGDRIQVRRDRRRTACHVRQIAMYVCHVALEMPMHDIGEAFGRARAAPRKGRAAGRDDLGWLYREPGWQVCLLVFAP